MTLADTKLVGFPSSIHVLMVDTLGTLYVCEELLL